MLDIDKEEDATTNHSCRCALRKKKKRYGENLTKILKTMQKYFVKFLSAKFSPQHYSPAKFPLPGLEKGVTAFLSGRVAPAPATGKKC